MKKSNVFIALLVGGVVLAAAYILYQQYPLFGWGGYGGYHMGRGMPGHWGMGLLMPLFWIVIICSGSSSLSGFSLCLVADHPARSCANRMRWKF